MMRIFLGITALLLAFQAYGQGISFTEGTWAEVKAKAKAEDKLIFMDAYTTWCGPCKWLAANVFTDEAVGELMNAQFINVKFDMEKGEGLDIAKEYGVRAYPTLLFIDGDGQLVHRICGAMPVEPFLEAMHKVVAKEGLISTLIDEYEDGNRSMSFMANYLQAMANACMDAEEAAQSFYASLDHDQVLQKEVLYLMGDFPPSLTSTTMRIVSDAYDDMKEEHSELLDNIMLNAVYRYFATSLRSSEDAFPAKKEEVLAMGLANLEYPLLRLDLMYYQRNGNWSGYVETATQLIDGYENDNPGMLNEIAWAIYESEAGAEADEMALEWARMAREMDKSYAILDTYAALLFKTGRKEEGKLAAQEAIEVAKASGEDYSGTEYLLEEYGD